MSGKGFCVLLVICLPLLWLCLRSQYHELVREDNRLQQIEQRLEALEAPSTSIQATN